MISFYIIGVVWSSIFVFSLILEFFPDVGKDSPNVRTWCYYCSKCNEKVSLKDCTVEDK